MLGWLVVTVLLLPIVWLAISFLTGSPFRRIRRRMLSTFLLEHLHALARLHLPIAGSLEACASRLPRSSGRILRDLEDNLREGLLVADALVQAPRRGGWTFAHLEDVITDLQPASKVRLLSPAEAEVLRIGEMSGSLEHALGLVIKERQRFEELRNWLHAAFIYPAAVFIVLFAVVSGVLVFIVPKFKEMFVELDVELPVMTQGLMHVADSFAHRWYWGVAILVALGFLLVHREGLLRAFTRGPRRIADLFRRLAYWVPFAHGPMRRALLGEFCRELAMLLRVGTPASRALRVIAGGTMNPWFRDRVARAAESCERGVDLASALDNARLGRRAGWFAQAATDTSDIADALDGLGEDYMSQVSWAACVVGRIVPPAIILVLGIVIGVSVISLFLPLVTLMNNMGG